MDRTSHSQSALPARFELLNRRCSAVIFSTLSRVDDGGAQSCSGEIRFPTHEKGIRDRIRGLMRPDASLSPRICAHCRLLQFEIIDRLSAGRTRPRRTDASLRLSPARLMRGSSAFHCLRWAEVVLFQKRIEA